MITITLSGCDTATSGDFTVRCAKNALHKIANAIEASGVHPETPVRVIRDTGTVCFNDQPLGFWAAHTISETDTGIRRAKFAPMPKGIFA